MSPSRAAGFDRLPFFLYFISGATALIYETVWIRLFAATFGNTAQAVSTVIAVFLAGLAAGAFLGGKKIAGKGLLIYGAIEAAIGFYALATPSLIHSAEPLLALVYQSAPWLLATARGALCAAIILPATLLMGATLPVLSGWLDSAGRVTLIYAINVAGACGGALLTGFLLLPGAGYRGTLLIACGLNVAIGGLCFVARGQPRPIMAADRNTNSESLPPRIIALIAFLSGWIFLLQEVAWNRLFGLLFGATASTLTLVLAAFLLGLAGGAAIASGVRKRLTQWLAFSQIAGVLLTTSASLLAGNAPEWVAGQVRAYNADPSRIELSKTMLLAVTVLPMAMTLGITFPLLIRLSGAESLARKIGGLYSINTLGAILGSLMAGWVLIPLLGTQTTLALGAAASLVAGSALLLQSKRQQWAIAAAFVLLLPALFPRWNMAALTAGAYKYAPYYESSVAQALGDSQVLYLKEGPAATVTVRKQRGSLTLAIDGKVDASDSGSDLLTEKLLAHLPLMLAGGARQVCVIGLASGVTAGSVLTWPVTHLDIAEVSPEVIAASSFFDGVNRSPLSDPRTSVLLADGRNHLALTAARYNLIISEPSNPWIAGMNGMFTREFFSYAKKALRPGGVMAQWFHVYNLPADDMKSLLRAFTDVFPSSVLWQLNDGDMLITGFNGASAFEPGAAPDSARQDLAGAGVSDPAMLSQLYRMRGEDLRRFASAAAPNTDDLPLLEFHGQRNLHLQTDAANIAELAAFPKQEPPLGNMHPAPQQLQGLGGLFEHAESPHLAFSNYVAAWKAGRSLEALAGMDRNAQLPGQADQVSRELGIVGPDARTLDSRTAAAAAKAQAGDLAGARLLFEENTLLYRNDPAAYFNYGVYWIQQKNVDAAIEQFRASVAVDAHYMPSLETLVQIYLDRRESAQAVAWSRRILEVNPNHAGAKRTIEMFASARQ